MPKSKKPSSKVSTVLFTLRDPGDEEMIDRISADSDYTGYPVKMTSDVVGQFLNVPECETQLLAVWFVGTLGIEFTSLTFDGVDLLKKHAKAIAAERAA